jgi:hypothetical protein
MASEFDTMLDLLMTGDEGRLIEDTRAAQEDARRRIPGQIFKEIERVGLPWKVPQNVQYPRTPSAMERVGGNLRRVGTLGMMEGAEAAAFENTYPPDRLREFMDIAGYPESEQERFFSNTTLQELLQLKYARPEVLLQDSLYRRLPEMDPAEMEEAKRQFLGQPPLREPFTSDAGDVVWFPDDTDPTGWRRVDIPHAPKGIHNIPADAIGIDPITGKIYRNPKPDRALAKRWIDTRTGKPISGTEQQMAQWMKNDPRRFVLDVQKQEVRTGDIESTTKVEIEKQLYHLIGLRDQLSLIQDSFNPYWLTWGGRLGATMMEYKSHAGILDAAGKLDLLERSGAMAQAAKVTNDMIRLMTGAQMSHKEAQRLMLQEINATGENRDAPDVFVGKLMKTMYLSQLAIARNRMILEKGLLKAEEVTRSRNWEQKFTLQEFRKAMLDEAEQMYQRVDPSLSESDAKSEMRQQMIDKYEIDPDTLTDDWVVDAFSSFGMGAVGQKMLDDIEALDRAEMKRRRMVAPPVTEPPTGEAPL